jgi:hypothetical protein
MLLYFSVTNHVDLFPLNNLEAAGSQLLSTLNGWAMFIPFMLLVRMRHRFAIFSALVISVVWVVLQFNQWYVPYLFDGGQTDWFVTNGYDQTLKLLPQISGHVVTPDLQHNILQLFSVILVVLAALDLRQSAISQERH